MGFHPVAVAAAVGGFVLGLLLEKRFGVVSRLVILVHDIMNAEVKARVSATYTGDIPFDHVLDEVKTVCREQYGTVDIAEEDDAVVLTVDDHYTVTVSPDPVTVETTRIVTTARGLDTDLGRFFTVLKEVEARTKAQSKGGGAPFEADAVTVELHLPYRSKYLDLHLPFGAWVSEHTFTIRHEKYDWVIRQDNDTTRIEAGSRREAERLVDTVTGPFLSF